MSDGQGSAHKAVLKSAVQVKEIFTVVKQHYLSSCKEIPEKF